MSTERTVTLDGAGGGGQVLRTALSLATVTGRPVRIDNIRGGRPDPGLNPQHLTAVELIATLCEADVEGAELDAESLLFRPGAERKRTLQTAVGTAGSITLLFDTVLPIAAVDDEPFELTATGGTNVKWAPTVEYHQLVKCPLLGMCGLSASIERSTTGFYPAGGGKATLRTTPSTLSTVALDARGERQTVEIYSKASEDLADREVADRQANHAHAELESAGVPAVVERIEYVPTKSTGSSLLLRGVYEQSVVGFDALGERGRSSEAVADAAVQQFTAFQSTTGAVDVFMADQLLLFVAVAGGHVRIPAVTEHVRTNLATITAFGSDMRLETQADGTAVVTASALEAGQ